MQTLKPRDGVQWMQNLKSRDGAQWMQNLMSQDGAQRMQNLKTVPSAENPEQTKVLPSQPGVGHNTDPDALSVARNSPLPNFCLPSSSPPFPRLPPAPYPASHNPLVCVRECVRAGVCVRVSVCLSVCFKWDQRVCTEQPQCLVRNGVSQLPGGHCLFKT